MEFINELGKVDFVEVFIGLVLMLFVFKEVWNLIIDIAGKLGIYTKASLEKKQMTNRINEIQSSIKSLEKQRNDDYQHYTDLEHGVHISVDDLSKKVDNLASSIVIMKTEIDETKKAELKDKIRKNYYQYNNRCFSDTEPVPYWNSMDQEAMEDLIREYERCGGKNSFVHSIVEPQMYTWKLVDE